MNSKIIKDITDVISGYAFRTALKPQEDGLMTVIQVKDVLGGLYINKNSLTKINLQKYQSKALVEENDVIISSRGSFKTNVIKGDAVNVIAASSVYILRIKNKDIIPEYLAIYLNSVEGQKKIREKTTGSVIKTILRKDLENLKIPLPNKDIQNKIIDLYKNNQVQQKLLTRKKTLINEIIESSISNFLK
ncbi:restriction endonuclease subunit S [bacterium]|nr:restriction endonuclease subunit S [bacterium]